MASESLSTVPPDTSSQPVAAAPGSAANSTENAPPVALKTLSIAWLVPPSSKPVSASRAEIPSASPCSSAQDSQNAPRIASPHAAATFATSRQPKPAASLPARSSSGFPRGTQVAAGRCHGSYRTSTVPNPALSASLSVTSRPATATVSTGTGLPATRAVYAPFSGTRPSRSGSS